MEKELDHNSTFLEISSDIKEAGRLASGFVRKHFGSEEFSTFSGNNETKSLTLGFGYYIDGHPREVGNIIYKIDLNVCVVVINDFAKKRFIDYMIESAVHYRKII